jgi:hypothetical protein
MLLRHWCRFQCNGRTGGWKGGRKGITPLFMSLREDNSLEEGFCGPYLSDFKQQDNVCSTTPATSAGDQCCKEHDCRLAQRYLSRKEIDYLFRVCNNKVPGLRPIVYKNLVDLAYILGITKDHKIMPASKIKQPKNVKAVIAKANKTEKMAEKLIGKISKMKVEKRPGGNRPSNEKVKYETVPVSYGHKMKGNPQKVVHSANGVTVSGSEFGSAITLIGSTSSGGSPTSLFYLAGIVNVHPAYFSGGILGNTARMYKYVKVNYIRYRWISTVPTSTNGDIVTLYVPDEKEKAINYGAATFLNRVISDKHSEMFSVWEKASGSCNPEKKKVFSDPTIDMDLNDSFLGDVYVFTSFGSISTQGYLIIDYNFTFSEPMLSLRSARVPYPNWQKFSPGGTLTCVDSANQVNSTAVLTTAAFTNMQVGDIYKVVLDATATTQATGTTLATMWSYQSGVVTSTPYLPITNGLTVYAQATLTNQLVWYATLEAAKVGSTSTAAVGVLVYSAGVSFKASYAGYALLIQSGIIETTTADI